MSVIYFAYGSNMNVDQIEERVSNFVVLGKAILHDYTLCFNKEAQAGNGTGYANIVYQKGEYVEGLLYEIDSLESLDDWEGFPEHYERVEMDVMFNNTPTKAWIYVANPNKIKSGLKPAREYLNKLLSAKEYLSEVYYKKLENTETID
ncbi:MAG: gamma-glutamylcyclotransferase [Chitinophagaceae bacterium]|nr:gamma-glutamylcyclotransferase [Chitinophagaceae bacterium]